MTKQEWAGEQAKKYLLLPKIKKAEERRLKRVIDKLSEAETAWGKDIREFSKEEILGYLQNLKTSYNETWMNYRIIAKFAKESKNKMWGILPEDVKDLGLEDDKMISEDVYLDIMTSEMLSSYKFVIGSLYSGLNPDDILLMKKIDLEAHAVRKQNGERVEVDELLIRSAYVEVEKILHRSHPLEEEDYILKLPQNSRVDRMSPNRIYTAVKYGMNTVGYSITLPSIQRSGMINRVNEMIRMKGVTSAKEVWQMEETQKIRELYGRTEQVFRRQITKFLIF